MSDSKTGFSVFFLWFAWAISVIASLLFLIDLISEGIPDVMKGKSVFSITYLPFLIIAMAGCFLSFFKQKPGAIMMIVGGVAIDVVWYLHGGQANFGMMVVFGLPYIFPGILLLLVKK